MTNKEWIDLLSKEFQVSRTVAKKMLHEVEVIKTQDTLFKKMLEEKKQC